MTVKKLKFFPVGKLFHAEILDQIEILKKELNFMEKHIKKIKCGI